MFWELFLGESHCSYTKIIFFGAKFVTLSGWSVSFGPATVSLDERLPPPSDTPNIVFKQSSKEEDPDDPCPLN